MALLSGVCRYSQTQFHFTGYVPRCQTSAGQNVGVFWGDHLCGKEAENPAAVRISSCKSAERIGKFYFIRLPKETYGAEVGLLFHMGGMESLQVRETAAPVTYFVYTSCGTQKRLPTK